MTGGMESSSSGVTVVGILGGIGSGKSLVAEILLQMGAEVFSADEVGHRALDDPLIMEQLVARWGAGILATDGHPDRQAIAAQVFQGPDADSELAFLEQLTHPRIGRELEVFIQQVQQRHDLRLAIIDAALLLEAGWDTACDELLFVEVDGETRWERCQRRGWSREQWEAREASQRSLDDKRGRASLVVDNNSDESALRSHLHEIFGPKGSLDS